MKMLLKWRRVVAVMCAALCALSFTVNTYAYSRIDTQKETSLTVSFRAKKTPVSDVKFELYYVADVNETVDFYLTEEFAGSDANLQGLDAAGWRTATEKLSDYVESKNIVPLTEKKTDTDGKVTFSGLETGLYLVIGESYSTADEIYTPSSFLISLPHLNDMDEWEYDAGAVVKYTVTPAKLPQTGQTWWPVVLVIPGIILIALGVKTMLKKDKNNENQA